MICTSLSPSFITIITIKTIIIINLFLYIQKDSVLHYAHGFYWPLQKQEVVDSRDQAKKRVQKYLGRLKDHFEEGDGVRAEYGHTPLGPGLDCARQWTFLAHGSSLRPGEEDTIYDPYLSKTGYQRGIVDDANGWCRPDLVSLSRSDIQQLDKVSNPSETSALEDFELIILKDGDDEEVADEEE